MRLWSYFKRDTPSTAPASSAGDELRRLRAQSRQRLIGAAVLIVVGVIGFPLVFETTPRPIAADIPIEIERKAQAPPPAAAVPRAPEVAAAEPDAPAASAERVAAPAEPPIAAPPKPVVEAPAPKVAAAPKPAADAARAPAKPKAEPAKPARGEDARARALLEGKDRKPAATQLAAAAGRFVVQVGAFSEEGAARDMRQKVEKLGMKTHTQQVATQAGSRILRVRVGPFPSRDEADRVAARLESVGVSSAVLAL